jgi:branched-chain amino acid aminotransferase
MTLAEDLGIPVDVAPITREELFEANEVFLTGTAAELVPAACVDDHVYDRNRPVTTRLHAAYRAATKGEDPNHPDWVTYVGA